MSRFRSRLSRTVVLAGLIGTVCFSVSVSFMIRFEGSVPLQFLDSAFIFLSLAILIKVSLFANAGFHRKFTSGVGLSDAVRIYGVNAGGSVLLFGGSHLLRLTVPGAVYLIDLLLCSLGVGVVVFGMRISREFRLPRTRIGSKRVLIYGAGEAGIRLYREIRDNARLDLQVVGFIDDNPHLRRSRVGKVGVLGQGRELAALAEKFRSRNLELTEILIAVPSACGAQLQEILANSRSTGLACKVVPSLGELLNEQSLSRQLREVSLADLLGRDPVLLDEDRIRERIAGQAVLITGGAGSIGSELCRQIALLDPSRLVILDQAESDLFQIDLELRGRFSNLLIVPEIADIRDLVRVDEVINNNGINIIFHAAAYKHVPLMEGNVMEAIQNNVIGTWNVVDSAVRHRVADLVMISSDKAVNPTNVMGATKRIAELIVAAAEGQYTKFVSVRFGNVLGSNGSVVPIFQQQIAQGGPITITHPEIRRFFMTIREAVQLVLQASTMGNGSEIFVLDMGEPVKITDLARSLIRLSGKVPDEEIEIRIIGLRPGEKLYEELISEGENIVPTYHPKIKIFKGETVSRERITRWIDLLQRGVSLRSEIAVVSALKEMVPEWQPSTRWQKLNDLTIPGQLSIHA